MMEERAKQQGYRNELQTREGRGMGSVWESLTARAGSSLCPTHGLGEGK